ncbi:hypothetical protein A2690_03370 [Candidatus Roizmanbacteria bacterium RIFCSPHIGHO2_01_FULL_39_12b]|uniref:Uncharacterized protein n=1 Tax=Candidatus Roizmanbacteria bacterium RIFCSPHIGHO2_01_FULL_39_12b TaxID=1802030 RepID=A0A1F7GCK3_9BACT|nr:MAG: hypothetical protein A2690_03370 [Candidatus Roizmanbacteria bacterium RIFCSPHIGHO2_01_FULL_39_12b]OGK46703.1 MAG: hypothetical protein A3B46_02620 [Candidatus Roizmanbacteria bacterium RIFCSPLOWO2_01_FULL_39_19]
MVYALEINKDIFPGAKIGDFGVLLSTLLPLVFIGASLLFLSYLIWGALDWIKAGNNKENVVKAQTKWRYAILGFIVMLTSLLMVKVLGYITRIPFPL